MKKLSLQNMWLFSEHEQAARHIPFHPRLTVITGTNDTGKSSAIKSIYETFGATAAIVNPKWREARASSVVQFELDGSTKFMVKSEGVFGIFDEGKKLCWRGTKVTRELGPKLAEMLDFNLELKNRQGKMQQATPAYCFLPFYVDQDTSWSRTWAGFESLQMFADYRRDAANFHSGIRPPDYYRAKGASLDADAQITETKTDKSSLKRAGDRLKSGRRVLAVDLKPELFADRIDALLVEANKFSQSIDEVQTRLNRLNSERVVLIEQKRAAESALDDLTKDLTFAVTHDEALICPTCGTEHESSFLNRLGITTDQDSCRAFINDASEEIEVLDEKIHSEREKLARLTSSAATINAILDERRGDLKLRDILEGESERLVDEAFVLEDEALDQRLARELLRKDEAQERMKALTDKDRSDEILGFYRDQMKTALRTLDVQLDEGQYKTIEGNIRETGSDLPRALLAYYYSFLHTLQRYGSSCNCPIVVDSPVQQDQDDTNARKLIEYATAFAPEGMQVVLGTVSTHGVTVEGRVIEFKVKNQLLRTEEFDGVKAIIQPMLDQLKAT